MTGRIAFPLILFFLISIVGQTQAQKAICNNGRGQFDTQFATGVSVRVGVGRSGAFATRMCNAILSHLAVDAVPVAILLWRPPLSPSQQSLARSQETLQLVIDEAGKVHSAELLFPNEDPELMNATKNWKFIPAIKDGQPVAYTMKLAVSPYQ